MAQVVVRERVYIPADKVSKRALEQAFEHDIYNKEYVCNKCPNLEMRPNDVCGTCDNYGGHIKLWSTWQGPATGTTYAVVPSGHLGRVSSTLNVDLSNIRDLRAAPKMAAPLRFTGRLYKADEVDSDGRPRPDQEGTVAQWMSKGYGIIRAQPRTGKTVMATYISCKLGLRTLVIADQEELLRQFYWTYMGRDHATDPKAAMTNAPAWERRRGQPSVGIVRNMNDLATLDVALMNYQKFIHENAAGTREDRIVQFINRRFGLLVVDECFPAGTPIATRAGAVPIEKIVEAPTEHEVLSFNHQTNETEYKLVVRGMKTPGFQGLIEIEHEKGTLRVTPEHPIWSVTRQQYVPAGELTPEDEILVEG